jgi:predicted transcriptional regulator
VKEKRMKLRDIYQPDAVTIDPDHDLTTAARPGDVWVSAHASFRPETAHVEEDSRDVARRMLDLGVRHLPVIAGNDQLVGMVSMRDLLAVEA